MKILRKSFDIVYFFTVCIFLFVIAWLLSHAGLYAAELRDLFKKKKKPQLPQQIDVFSSLFTCPTFTGESTEKVNKFLLDEVGLFHFKNDK